MTSTGASAQDRDDGRRGAGESPYPRRYNSNVLEMRSDLDIDAMA
jgi:hypothetical protein